MVRVSTSELLRLELLALVYAWASPSRYVVKWAAVNCMFGALNVWFWHRVCSHGRYPAPPSRSASILGLVSQTSVQVMIAVVLNPGVRVLSILTLMLVRLMVFAI